MISLLLAITSIVAGSASAVSVLRWPGPTSPNSLWISPVKHNGTLLGPAPHPSPHKGAQKSAAEWYVAQWNNPDPITEDIIYADAHHTPSPACRTKTVKTTSQYSLETGASRVCHLTAADGTRLVQLASSGKGTGLACGTEFDMFLAPLDGAYPKYTPANVVDGLPLAAFNRSELKFFVSLETAEWTSRCGRSPQCSGTPDYGYITLGIPLSNPTGRETTFYQLGIYDSRWNQCGESMNMCNGNRQPGWYFHTLPTLGVNIPIAAFPGQTCIQGAGDTRSYSVDVLPSLKAMVALAAKQFGADGNLAHWHVGGVYLGHGIQGNMVMTTVVGNVSFTYA